MKKSLLKRSWEFMLHGLGRDVLALTLAGTMMLTESPLGYARIAFADELTEGSAAVEAQAETAVEPDSEAEVEASSDEQAVVEPEQSEPEASDAEAATAEPVADPEASEPTTVIEAQPESTGTETVESLEGTAIVSVKLFGELRFFSLYTVDKDGRVASDKTTMPVQGLSITDELEDGWRFTLVADENYEIDSVAYRVGNGQEVALNDKDGVYAIPQEAITQAHADGQDMTLVVKTHATGAKIAVDLSTYALYQASSDGTVAQTPTVTAPTRSFNVPLDKAFSFAARPVVGYVLESVSAQVGTQTTELEADEDGIYTITTELIAAAAESGDPVQLLVVTSQDDTVTTDGSNLPVPIGEDATVSEGEDEALLVAASDALAPSAREFSHNLSDYLDRNYDTSTYGVSGIKINGTPIDEVETISYGDDVEIKLAWGFPNTMAVKAGDQFTYQLPESIGWVFDSSAATGGVFDEMGTQVGNFVIDGNGLATITYTSDLGSNVVGSFTANGIITRIVEDGAPAIVSFSLAGREWKKEYISGEAKVEVNKTGGEYVPDADDLTLRQFTIEVLSLGENTGIEVSDNPSTVTINKTTTASLVYQEGSLQVFSDAACTHPVSDGRVSVSEVAADGSFTIYISEMGNFERLYLRYQSRITNEAYNAAVGRSWNHAVAELNGGYDHVSSTISNTASVTSVETSSVDVPSFLPSYVIRKTGKYDAETRTITWTVEAMTGDNTLTLQDYPGTGLGGIENIQVFEGTDGKTWTEASAEVAAHITAEGLMDGTAMLPAATTAGGRRYFKITFDTPVNPYAVGQTSYENWIAGNGRTFTSGKGVGAWVTVDTGTRVSAEKTSVPQNSYVNYDAQGNIVGTPEDIHWVSHLSVPVAETPYTDFVITDSEGNGNDQHITEGSVHVYSDAAQTTEITSQFDLAYTYGNAGRTDQYISGFTLTSDSYAGGELYITCDATIVKVSNNRTFTNRITVDASEFGAAGATGYHYVNMHRLSKRWEPDLAGPDGWRGSGWTHTNSNTGRVTWTVVVSGLGNGELDLNPDVVVTDSAPDRLVVDPDSFRFVIGYIDGWHTVAGERTAVHDIVPTISGGTITFVITTGGDAYEALRAGKSIVLVYDTTYNPDYSTDGYSQQADKVTNTVSLTFGENTLDTTSSSFTFKHQELLTKEAVYNESTAPNALFTIHCNYWGGDLDPNSDSLTLTDQPGSALSINTNTITITTYDSTGKVIDDAVPIADMAGKGFSYTRDTRTGAVTFTVPDSLHFSISYESLVTLAPGATIEDESASNTVSLAGYTTPSRTSIGSEVYASRATTTSIGYGVSIEKIDADYTSLHVANATYAVERVDVSRDGGSWMMTGAEEIGRLTTAESGFSPAMTGLAADQVYRLREVSSPEGYDLSDDVFYLVFQGSQGDETIDYGGVTLHDDSGRAVELEVYSSDSAVKRILMSDHQTPGGLTITKTSEGTETPGTTTFTVTGPNNYSHVFYYSAFRDGQLVLDDLVPGSYTVTEDVDSAHKDSYELVVRAGGEITNTQTVTVEAGGTGEAAAQVSFTNEYTRKETEVNVAKTWVGPMPAGAVVTVHLLADGARLDPDVTLELSADNDWRGTFRGLPIYDETDPTREISYTVEEDAVGGYEASYAGDAVTGYTITNTFAASATVTAFKYAYGEQGTYSFTLRGATETGALRSSGSTGTFEIGEGVVDEGQALTVTVTNGGYIGARSTVAFPEITYRAAGDYYYLLSEDAVAGEPYDDTVYLVHVAVAEDGSVSVDYTPQGLGSTSGTAEFYNNGGLVLFGMSAGFATETDAVQLASFTPMAHKELDGRALAADEFSFLLLDDAGNTVARATNDVDGVVAFDRVLYDTPGTYHYTMVEENTGQVGVDYDFAEHDVVVTVEADDAGVLSVTSATYDGVEDDLSGTYAPTFANAVQVVIVRIRKVSRDGSGDPLFNSVYGLWIEGTDGNSDIYLGNDASDEDGYIYIENVPVVEGATYYFKEESAPEGHLVDPYRIAHFRIDRADDGSYTLVSLES